MKITEGEIPHITDKVEMDALQFFGIEKGRGEVLPKCCYGVTHILVEKGGVECLKAGIDCDELYPVRGIEEGELRSLIFGMNIDGDWKGVSFFRKPPPGLYKDYKQGGDKRRDYVGEIARGRCGCKGKLESVIKQILLKNGSASVARESKGRSRSSLSVEDALLENGAAAVGINFPARRDKRKKWVYRAVLITITFGILILQLCRELGGFRGEMIPGSLNESALGLGGKN